MKKVATSLFFIAIGFFSLTSAVPGKPVAASISADMLITLPADQPLSDKYVVDISSLNILTATVLEDFCSNFSEQNMTLTGDFEGKKIGISLEPMKDSAGNIWDVAKWNAYLSSRAPKMAMFMQTYNK